MIPIARSPNNSLKQNNIFDRVNHKPDRSSTIVIAHPSHAQQYEFCAYFSMLLACLKMMWHRTDFVLHHEHSGEMGIICM